MKTLVSVAILSLLAFSASAQQQEVNAGASAGVSNLVQIGGSGGSGGSTRIHTTPDAIAAGIIPSAPCIVSHSAAAGFTGFGLSVGSGTTDFVCQGANLAAIAAQVHQSTGLEVAREIAASSLIIAHRLYQQDVAARLEPKKAKTSPDYPQ